MVASPGTTNICFINSIQHDPWFEIYSSVDERSAAYIAVGLAAERGEPVVLICTCSVNLAMFIALRNTAKLLDDELNYKGKVG